MQHLDSHDQAPQPTTPEPAKRKGLRAFIAGIAFMGAVGGGVAAVEHFNAQPGKNVATVGTAKNPETSQAFQEVVDKVAHPKVGDTFTVAQGIFKLKEGATVTDSQGNKSVLAKAIDGIQSPAWTPKKNVLCFMQQKGTANCFDIVENQNFIEAVVPVNGHNLSTVPASAFTPENAAQATVTMVEGDGFAYGSVDNHKNITRQYFAGRPSGEGDTLSGLPS